MSFHANTFRLLGTEPRLSASAAAEVERAEQVLGFRLPASVREWYAYDGAIEILAKHSNQDPPIPPAKFVVAHWQSHHLLPFRDENQGVCTWSILLDGSDDPPVYVDVDSGGTQWQILAPTFSTYVYTSVWDYSVVFNQPGLVQAQHEPLSAETIAALEQMFVALPKTYGWPGSTQYRFAGKECGVLIWGMENEATYTVAAEWFVGAANEQALEGALRSVWRLDNVGWSFYDCFESDMACEVLARLRGKL